MSAALEVAHWLVDATVVFVLMGVLYQIAQLQRRIPDYGALVPNAGLSIGAVAPDFTTGDRRNNREVRFSDYHGRRLVLGFLSPACRPCSDLIPHLNRFAADRRAVPVLIVALDGRGVDYARELSERIVVLDDPHKVVQQAYAVTQAPLIYLVDEDGKVVNRTIANHLVDLEAALDGRTHSQGPAAWVPAKDPQAADTIGIAQ